MRDFTFLCPTKLIVGHKAEQQTGKLLKEYGATNVLVHHDSAYLKECGLIDQIINNIKAEGIGVVELGGVVPNPRLSKIYEGIELCRNENVDFLLAIGGGSVIDSVKGIAMGIPYDGDVWDFYAIKDGVPRSVPKTSTPLAVILTLPASGSECSNSSVVTKDDESLKRFCDTDLNRARFVIENPELTMTLPRIQTACGVLDIMSHSFERYFTRDRGNELTDRLCEAIFHTCMDCGRVLIDEPDNYDARASIMIAGSLSHNGLTGMGRQDDWAAHFIEHELSGEYDLTHGAGLAAIIPAWMKYVYKNDIEIFVKWATRVMGCSYDYENPKRTVEEAISRLELFIQQLGLKTHLSENRGIPDITEEAMWKMAKRVRVNNDIGTIGWYKKLSHNDIVNIIKLAL
ncbi:MAG: iron-containing alcohol dehydrogenase [Christensenella sp.]